MPARPARNVLAPPATARTGGYPWRATFLLFVHAGPDSVLDQADLRDPHIRVTAGTECALPHSTGVPAIQHRIRSGRSDRGSRYRENAYSFLSGLNHHGLHAPCVRFAAAVTHRPRNTRFWLMASLCQTGFTPVRSASGGFRVGYLMYSTLSPPPGLPGAIPAGTFPEPVGRIDAPSHSASLACLDCRRLQASLTVAAIRSRASCRRRLALACPG